MSRQKSRDAGAILTEVASGDLVATSDYPSVRRALFIASLATAAFFLAVGGIVGLRPGMLPFLWISIALALLMPFLILEVLPGVDSTPHHVAADSGGLILVRRYLLKDHLERHPWSDVIGVGRPGHGARRSGRYVVTYRKGAKGWLRDSFAISESAFARLRGWIPSAIPIE